MTRALGITAIALLSWGMVSAAPLACAPGNLADYINLDPDGCTLGNARVFDFIDLGPIGGATGITADQVFVTPFGGATTPGLQFLYEFSAGPFELLESRFEYKLETPGAMILSALLGMTGSTVAPDGANTVVEEFCTGGDFVADICSGSPGTAIVFDIGTDEDLSERLELGLVSSVVMRKDVVIDGGTSGSASLEAVTNEFVLVPEPLTGPTLALGMIALAGLGTMRRLAGGRAK